MNAQQVKEVFDSLHIEWSLRNWEPRILFAEGAFCIMPALADASKWLIYILVPRRRHIATVTDEFELQDWLINEYNSN